MQFGSENYQFEDSYFVVGNPFIFVLVGLLGLACIIAVSLKKINK